jgi:hypothetical protein
VTARAAASQAVSHPVGLEVTTRIAAQRRTPIAFARAPSTQRDLEDRVTTVVVVSISAGIVRPTRHVLSCTYDLACPAV